MNYLCTNGYSLFLENHCKGSSNGAHGWKHTNEPFIFTLCCQLSNDRAGTSDRGPAPVDTQEQLGSHSLLCSVSSMYIPGFLTQNREKCSFYYFCCQAEVDSFSSLILFNSTSYLSGTSSAKTPGITLSLSCRAKGRVKQKAYRTDTEKVDQ